jgi:hypothetical protein
MRGHSLEYRVGQAGAAMSEIFAESGKNYTVASGFQVDLVWR